MIEWPEGWPQTSEDVRKFGQFGSGWTASAIFRRLFASWGARICASMSTCPCAVEGSVVTGHPYYTMSLFCDPLPASRSLLEGCPFQSVAHACPRPAEPRPDCGQRFCAECERRHRSRAYRLGYILDGWSADGKTYTPPEAEERRGRGAREGRAAEVLGDE